MCDVLWHTISSENTCRNDCLSHVHFILSLNYTGPHKVTAMYNYVFSKINRHFTVNSDYISHYPCLLRFWSSAVS